MVSVTLIFEAFKHVAKSPFLIMEHLLGNYIFFLISPWWLAWYPSELVTLGKGLHDLERVFLRNIP
jgi:hypothetical protein